MSAGGSRSLNLSPDVPDQSEEESKRKLRKKEGGGARKDIGYVMFEQEPNSEEEELVADPSLNKSSVKPKKLKPSKPSFKFSKKEKPVKVKEKDKEKCDKEEKKEKEKKDKLDKEQKREEEKEQKLSKKKSLGVSQSKVTADTTVADLEATESKLPVFGIPLHLAVERSPCHDGIQLPVIVRECIDYIEEFGLTCEGIYRVSGVKSKVQSLKDAYNKGTPVYLHEHEPSVVASLLKQFLRELSEPVLTLKLNLKFEQASTLKNVKQKVEQFQQLIEELPVCNRVLLSWMIVHMTHVIAKEVQNKMTLQNVSIVLSPTMQISHRVLNILFTYSKILFKDVDIKRYVPPLRPVTSRWTLELPESPSAIEEELKKQESLLSHLHEELIKVKDMEKEEQLWEVQRIVTQLKRKLKHAKQVQQSADMSRKREEEIARDKQLDSSTGVHYRSSTHSRTKDRTSVGGSSISGGGSLGGGAEQGGHREESGGVRQDGTFSRTSGGVGADGGTPGSGSRASTTQKQRRSGEMSRKERTKEDPSDSSGGVKSANVGAVGSKEKLSVPDKSDVSASKSGSLSEIAASSAAGDTLPVTTVAAVSDVSVEARQSGDENRSAVRSETKGTPTLSGTGSLRTVQQSGTKERKDARRSPAVVEKHAVIVSSSASVASVAAVKPSLGPSQDAKPSLETQIEVVVDASRIKELDSATGIDATHVKAEQIETMSETSDTTTHKTDVVETSKQIKIYPDSRDSVGLDVLAMETRELVESSVNELNERKISDDSVVALEKITVAQPVPEEHVEKKEAEEEYDNDSSSNAYTDVLEELDDLESDDEGEKAEGKGKGEVMIWRDGVEVRTGTGGVREGSVAYIPLGDEESSPGGAMSAQRRAPPRGDDLYTDTTETTSSVESDAESSTSVSEGEGYEELERELIFLKLQEEELLAIGDELRQKIATENDEIECLHQDIAEVHSIHQEMSSSDDDASVVTSSSEETDEETDDQLREILLNLTNQNQRLEDENTSLCEKIHTEREICIGVKVQIRVTQQRQLDTSGYGLDGFTDREALL